MKIGTEHTIKYEELLTEAGEFLLTADGDIITIGVINDVLIRIPIRTVCQGYYLRWYYNGFHYWFFHPGTIIYNTEGEDFNTLGTRKISMGSGQVTYEQINALRTIRNSREIQLFTADGWMNVRIEPGSVQVKNNYINGYEFDFVAIIGSREISITGFSPIIDIPIVPPDPDPSICEVIIGTQIWMCKNYDSKYPGSKVYDDDEANRAIYGGLYTFNQVNAAGFAPAGWHVPTQAEWQALIDYMGGDAAAGEHLKEDGVVHWDVDNADNISGFTALGAGHYYPAPLNDFSLLKLFTAFWTSTAYDTGSGYITQAYTASLLDTEVKCDLLLSNIDIYYSVRLLKNVSAPAPTITDIDGNVYTYVNIGTQQWLVENLKTTKYADGTPIPNLTLDADWIAEDGSAGHDGAYCWYNNDIANKADYGALYNWHAVNNAHGLAITGWRVASFNDWDVLRAYLGGDLISGGKLKESGIVHWTTPNTGATNETGFTALPGGLRSFDLGIYSDIHDSGFWFTSTERVITAAWYNQMYHNQAKVRISGNGFKRFGFSVRLMRDL